MLLKPRQPILDTYWYFAAERQSIFFKKLHGNAWPFTNDPILRQYKFCNVYRAQDRVSQFLIGEVIYSQERSSADTLFRIFLFRLLNKTESWVQLERELGDISLEDFDFETYAQVIDKLKAKGQVIYGNAFILCANKVYGYSDKHRNHLKLLETVFNDPRKFESILQAKSMSELFTKLRELPLIGDFMAYQLVTDFNYSTVFNFDENDFTVVGPGSKRGIEKCFESTGGMSYEEVIMWMVEHQDEEFARLNLSFKRLGDRPLKAIDCQGIFCETDKYCRVKFPELVSNRKRIKAEYRPTEGAIQYFFPPKWHIDIA